MPAFRKSSNNKRLVLSVKSSGFPAREGFDSLIDLRSARALRGRRSERLQPRPPLSRPPWGDLRSRDGNARPRGLTGYPPPWWALPFEEEGGLACQWAWRPSSVVTMMNTPPSRQKPGPEGTEDSAAGQARGPRPPPHGSLTVSRSAQGSHRAAWVPCDLDLGILGGPMTKAFFLLRNI